MRRLLICTTLMLIMLGSLTPASAAGPELLVTSPSSSQVIQGTDVKVAFKTSGFDVVASNVPLSEYGKRPDANKTDQGHLHFALDLWPLVVWEHGEAYTFHDVPPGEHQLKVELVNNDHSMREPSIAQVIRFRTEAAPIPAMMPRTGADQPSYALVLMLGLALLVAGWTLRRHDSV